QPERDLGDLDGERVDVDAVEAALGHEPSRGEVALLEIGARVGGRLLGVELPGFDEPGGEVAAGRDEEGSRAHGDVAHLQLEELRGPLQLPLLPWRALGGAAVDDGLERVLDDRLGQARRRVVRPSRAPEGALGDVDAALAEDQRVAEDVVADKAGEGKHALDELRVVPADGAETRKAIGVELGVKCLAKRRDAPTGLVLEEREQRLLALGALGLELGQRDLGLLALRAHEPERRRVGAERRVLEEAFVDVADLLDPEGTEAERAPLAAAWTSTSSVCSASSTCRTARFEMRGSAPPSPSRN